MGEIAKKVAAQIEANKLAVKANEEALARVKALGGPTGTGPTIAAKLGGEGDVQVGSQAGMDNDIYKGKGLMFARAVRVRHLAALEGWSEEKAMEFLFMGRDTKSLDARTKAMARTYRAVDEKRFEGIFKGSATSTDHFADIPSLQMKALGESTFGGGGVFVPDELSMEFIDILRPMIAMLKAGIERVPMAHETLTFARENVAAQPGWVGENAAVPFSEQQFDSPQLQLKKLGVLTVISNDLLRDASIAPDVIVRNDLIKQALLALDLALIRGLGGQFSPKGVRYVIAASQVINSVVGGGTGTYATALRDINNLKKTLAQANVPEVRRAWLCAPRTTLGFDLLTDQVGGTPLGNEMSQKKTLRGYPFFETTQIPVNLSGGGSGGSAESELTLLEASEWVMGEGMQPTVDIERNGAYADQNGTVQSGLSRDQTAIRLVLRADIIAKHAASATVGNGMTYGS